MPLTTNIEQSVSVSSDVATRVAPFLAAKVWDRVWQSRPTAERDDSLLAREAAHARWAWIRGSIIAAFSALQQTRSIELGSGRGDWSALLAKEGADATLFDASDRALAQAGWRFDRLGLRANFARGDLFSLPSHLLGRFDVAMSSGVIEHFRGDERTMSIASHATAVRPGGLVVVSVPHAFCPTYRLWKTYLELRGWWPYGYEQPFTASELACRGKAAGLVNVRTRCFAFLQSMGDHVLKGLLGRDLDWSRATTPLDHWFGSMLVLVGRRPKT